MYSIHIKTSQSRHQKVNSGRLYTDAVHLALLSVCPHHSPLLPKPRKYPLSLCILTLFKTQRIKNLRFGKTYFAVFGQSLLLLKFS